MSSKQEIVACSRTAACRHYRLSQGFERLKRGRRYAAVAAARQEGDKEHPRVESTQLPRYDPFTVLRFTNSNGADGTMVRCVAGLVLACSICGVAQAGSITEINSVGGPGGTGNGQIDLNSSSQADFNMYFTSVNAITVTLTVDGPGQYIIEVGPTPSYSDYLYNNTSESWTTLYVAGPGENFANQGSIFNSYLQGTDQGWLYGTTWDPGVFSGIVLEFAATEGGTYSYNVIPNVALGMSPVPEPASWSLLGIGIAMMFAIRRSSSRIPRGFRSKPPPARPPDPGRRCISSPDLAPSRLPECFRLASLEPGRVPGRFDRPCRG